MHLLCWICCTTGITVTFFCGDAQTFNQILGHSWIDYLLLVLLAFGHRLVHQQFSSELQVSNTLSRDLICIVITVWWKCRWHDVICSMGNKMSPWDIPHVTSWYMLITWYTVTAVRLKIAPRGSEIFQPEVRGWKMSGLRLANSTDLKRDRKNKYCSHFGLTSQNPETRVSKKRIGGAISVCDGWWVTCPVSVNQYHCDNNFWILICPRHLHANCNLLATFSNA